MKKTVSMIAAILLTASVAMAGSVSAFAEEAVSTTTTAAAAAAEDQGTNETTETTAVETTAAETTAVETTAVETTAVETTAKETTETPATLTKEEAEAMALADAQKDGSKFNVVNESVCDEESGCWVITLQREEGTKRLIYHVTANIIEKQEEEGVENLTQEAAEKKAVEDANKGGENYAVKDSSYDEEKGCWIILVQRVNGNKEILYHIYADKLEKFEEATPVETTTAAGTTAAGAATTTTAAGTTAKAAATTTKKADNKSASPKTGDAFPALPVAGVAVAAVAGALALTRKKNG